MEPQPDKSDAAFEGFGTAPRRDQRSRPPRKKRSLWSRVLIVGSIAFATTILLALAVLGTLLEVNEKSLAGKWVVDPQPGKPIPVELLELRIELQSDGEKCTVWTQDGEYTSSWEAEPYGFEPAARVYVPKWQGGGKTDEFTIRVIDWDHIELTDRQAPARTVRMKRVDSFNRRAGD
jgi:hypothetical protein